MENNMTKTEKVTNFFKVNKSRIIKGTLVVAAIGVGFLGAKYLQLKGANEVLELTASVPEETSDLVEIVEEVIQSNN